MTRATKLLLGGAIVVLLGVTLLVGLGFDIPGPKIREKLGLVEKQRDAEPPCDPRTADDRTPDRPGPAKGRWRKEHPIPFGTDELRAAALAGRIYLAGGHSRDSASIARVDEFDPRTGRYERLPDMPQRLDHVAMVSHGDSIFVIGGWTDSIPTNQVWRYSTKARRWTEVASMHVSRGSPAAAVVDGRIYVAGGAPANTAKPHSSVEVYDIGADRWEFAPDIPTASHHNAAAVVGGQIYVVGGRTPGNFSLDAIQRLDPGRGNWTKLPPLPAGSGGLAAVEHDGRLIAIAGGDDPEGWVTSAVWQFDPNTEAWRRLPDLPIARHGHAAAVANGRIYVFGGSPCAGFGLTGDVRSLDP